MAKLNHIKAAAKDIYTYGKEVEYKSLKGKNIGQMLTKIDMTQPRDKDDPIFIKKGEPYYWWQFMYQSKRYSKTPPKQSELINSPFLSQIASIQERMGEYQPETKEDFESFRDEIVEEIQGMYDECDEKFNNMPDSLQSAPSGETLSNRMEELESWKSEIEGIECEEVGEKEDDEDEDEYNDKLKEAVSEAMESLNETGYNGE